MHAAGLYALERAHHTGSTSVFLETIWAASIKVDHRAISLPHPALGDLISMLSPIGRPFLPRWVELCHLSVPSLFRLLRISDVSHYARHISRLVDTLVLSKFHDLDAHKLSNFLQLGAFLCWHIYKYDRFRCLKYVQCRARRVQTNLDHLRWNNGPYSGAFKRVMTVRCVVSRVATSYLIRLLHVVHVFPHGAACHRIFYGVCRYQVPNGLDSSPRLWQ